MTVEEVARTLSVAADRPIVDRTDLRGYFEVTLKFFDGPPERRGINDDMDLFTALREQLGLKLVPEREPVDVLVIDRIERPTED